MEKSIYLFVSLTLISSCSNINNEEKSTFSFLPDESEVILIINDLNNTKEILKNNEILDNISSLNNTVLNQLNSLAEKNSDNTGLLSISSFSKNEIAYTYIRETNSGDSIFQTDILKGEYQKNKIFIDTINLNKVYKTILDNYIISSSQDIILENIIRDYNLSNQKRNLDFFKLLKATDQDDPFNIFTKSNNLSLLGNKLSNISFFPVENTSWISYDFKYDIDNINLTGVTKIKDSINSKLSIFKNIIPSKIEADNFIPNSFLSFLSFTINDSERFIFNFKNYLKANDFSSEKLSFNSLNLINEISLVEDQEKFIILGITNTDQLYEYFRLNEFDDINNIRKIDIDEDLKILINKFDQGITSNYAVLIENSLVITESISQIKKIINSHRINDNLGSNSKYSNFKNKKAKKFSFLWVANASAIELNPKNLNQIDTDIYPYIGFSGSINQDVALLELDYSNYVKTDESEDIYTEFFLTFENEIITDPIWVKNHVNDQFDFVFQDSDNYLYYYSNKGEQYWKQRIPQKIIGEIKQIDTYKNGRLQIVFRTKDNFYVLDRNGKKVQELNFKIDSGKIYNPISIFDYEKNRNYRFLITSDKVITMMDSKGKIVSGFNPESFGSNIINSPVHIRIDGKDYIIVQLESGELKILDRRGRDRIIINEKIKFSTNSIYSYLKNFTTTDTQGNLIQVNLDGKLSKKNLNFSYDNLINIKDDNLVYVSENNLSIRGINVKLPYGRYSKPIIFKESGNMLIGITDLNESNVYLYKNNGELVKGFPIKGNSIIDIRDSDNDNKIEILTRLDEFSVASYEIN